MVIIGLTGSIGMGKSTAAAMFRQLGVPVHDSDAVVHRLMGPGGAAVAAIGTALPGTVRDGAVDRQALSAWAFGDPTAIPRLEAILHPLVRAASRAFVERARRRRVPVAVLDIPLLFETGAERRCDLVAVVSAPAFIQRQRVLRRPGMTPDKLRQILARQVPDALKRRRADRVIRSGLGRAMTFRALKRLVREVRQGGDREFPAEPCR